MSALRRNACPTLGAPMATGDGLLARLRPASGSFAPDEVASLARAAAQHGNGILEVTQRGSLQIRGLSEASARALGEEVRRMGLAVREGLPVETGPLAGLDPTEHADPRPLAADIALQSAAFASRLGPKVSVVMDGGGRIGMMRVLADIRLEAMDNVRWRVSVGGTAETAAILGIFDPHDAVAEGVRLLERLAQRGRLARGRDLLPANASRPASSDTVGMMPPVGVFPLGDGTVARGAALPFGQIDAASLAALAETGGADAFRLGLDYTLLLLCKPDKLSAVERAAEVAGLILDPADPRLRISACAGAPACHAGLLDTKALAKALAPALPAGHGKVHLSGCPKRCAEPKAAVLVEGREGAAVVNGVSVASGHVVAAIGQALRERQEQSAA